MLTCSIDLMYDMASCVRIVERREDREILNVNKLKVSLCLCCILLASRFPVDMSLD